MTGVSKKQTPSEIIDAWHLYHASQDETAKDQLIAHYDFLVKQLARPFYYSKPFILDYDDLLQAGKIGLIQAIERYKFGKDAMFETFAQLRIRGAILDEINSLDWTPRSVRKNIRSVIKAEEKITSQGGNPTTDQIAAITGLTPADVYLAHNQALRTFVLPVNQESMRAIESQLNEQETERVFYQMGILSKPNGQDVWTSLTELLTDLEKSVLLLRFYYDETMVRTAKILNITANAVSSTQYAALAKLKANFNEQDFRDN